MLFQIMAKAPIKAPDAILIDLLFLVLLMIINKYNKAIDDKLIQAKSK